MIFLRLHNLVSRFSIKKRKKTFNIEEKRNKKFCKLFKNFFDTFIPHLYEEKQYWTYLNINLNDYDYSNSAVDLITSSNGLFETINK